MKTDLTTAIITAIIGVVLAFFVTNLILPGVGNISFKTVSGGTNYSLTEPDSEIFNFRSLNPTVEVFVGQEE